MVALGIVLSIMAPVDAQTDAPGKLPASSAATPVSTAWTLGAFADVGYLHSFNDPPNRLFRSRGTTWHLDQWHLNMAGAYVRRVATEASRWGGELMVHTGKDDEGFVASMVWPR